MIDFNPYDFSHVLHLGLREFKIWKGFPKTDCHTV